MRIVRSGLSVTTSPSSAKLSRVASLGRQPAVLRRLELVHLLGGPLAEQVLGEAHRPACGG